MRLKPGMQTRCLVAFMPTVFKENWMRSGSTTSSFHLQRLPPSTTSAVTAIQQYSPSAVPHLPALPVLHPLATARPQAPPCAAAQGSTLWRGCPRRARPAQRGRTALATPPRAPAVLQIATVPQGSARVLHALPTQVAQLVPAVVRHLLDITSAFPAHGFRPVQCQLLQV